MSPLARTFTPALFLALGSPVLADLPHVDITLVPGTNNDLEVHLRPDGDFQQVLSSVVFTVRWDAASNASLGATTQPVPASQYVGIDKSGSETDDSGYRYQSFAGFGFVQLSSIPTQWTAGNEYVIADIPVINGQSAFTIVNDTWTGVHNGDYYISLNGSDQTGAIYEVPTGVMAGIPADAFFNVLPNPTSNNSTVTVSLAHPSETELTLSDAAGKEMWTRRFGVATSLHEQLDLSSLGSGVYYLRLRSADGTAVRRVVKK